MYTAEDGENKACHEGHRDREQRRQDSVKDELYELEKSMAANPHRIEAVYGAGFADHILKVHLEREREQREDSELSNRSSGSLRAIRCPSETFYSKQSFIN